MKKITVAALIVLMTIAFPFSAVLADNASDLKALEEKIEAAKQNASDYSEVAELLTQQTELLDTQIDETQAKIDGLNAQISEAEAKLTAAQSELDAATADRVTYQKQLDDRLAVMYMNGDKGYLEVLFGAENFADFIERVNAVTRIIKYDNEIALKLQEAEALIEQKTTEITEQKTSLEALQAEATAEQNNLEAQKSEKEASFEEAKENEAYWTAMAKQEEAEAAELRRIIASSNSDSNFANTYTTFLWPIPGHYQITSPYGYRYHPIYGYYKFHYGVDVGANLNNQIIAPANGKVILARYYGGYGNCVILDLGKDTSGNQYKMLFAHMNSLNCSVGDIVGQGQVIGFAGTTGSSTGVHLHFEVIINGTNYNPLDYVTK